jgi:hypothetical protein
VLPTTTSRNSVFVSFPPSPLPSPACSFSRRAVSPAGLIPPNLPPEAHFCSPKPPPVSRPLRKFQTNTLRFSLVSSFSATFRPTCAPGSYTSTAAATRPTLMLRHALAQEPKGEIVGQAIPRRGRSNTRRNVIIAMDDRYNPLPRHPQHIAQQQIGRVDISNFSSVVPRVC